MENSNQTSEVKKIKRKNGFQGPASRDQVLVAVAFIISVVAHYLLTMTFLPHKIGMVIAIISSVLNGLALINWYIATVTDPEAVPSTIYGGNDHIAAKVGDSYNSKLGNTINTSLYSMNTINFLDKKVKRENPTVDIERKYADVKKIKGATDRTSCKSISKRTTTYCAECGKTINQMDHHCSFLNNCIAKDNYISFILLICCCALEMLLHVIVGIFAQTIYKSEEVARDELHGKIWALYLIFDIQTVVRNIPMEFIIFYFI